MRTRFMNPATGVALTFLAGMTVGAGAQPANTTDGARDARGEKLGPVTAAIVEANASAELAMTLVARLEVQPNEILEIYEPAPGVLLISGAGAPAGPLRVTPEMAQRPVEELWSLVADGHPMPPRLQAAVENARQRRLDSPPALQSTRPPSGFGGGSAERHPLPVLGNGEAGAHPLAPSAPQAGWCDTGYYTSGWGSCDSILPFQVCLDNWWNGAYAYQDDIWILNSNVCPAQGGSVLYWIRSDEDFGGLWTVAQNTVRWFNYFSDCPFTWANCPYIRADVLNAKNKRFHFRFESDAI